MYFSDVGGMLQTLLKPGGNLRAEPRSAVRPNILNLSTFSSTHNLSHAPTTASASTSLQLSNDSASSQQQQQRQLLTASETKPSESCSPGCVQVLYHPDNPNPGNPNNGLFYLWQVGVVWRHGVVSATDLVSGWITGTCACDYTAVHVNINCFASGPEAIRLASLLGGYGPPE